MNTSDDDQSRQTVLGAFAKQIGWCESLGSPFTARLLTVLADDIAVGGTSAELVRAWPGDPVGDALALRMAAALHALALTGSAPALVACYPPHAATMEQLRSVVVGVVKEHRTYIRAFLSSAPQTNEVGRSGVLVGGFLQIAKETGLPLRLLEIGASAGLNAVWDRYHYQFGAAGWGDPQSAVRIAPNWEGPLAAARRPCASDRTSCLRHGASRSRGPRSTSSPESLCLARSAGTLVPLGERDWLGARLWPKSRARRRRRMGQSKGARTRKGERNRALPFHHVAVSAGRESGGH